VALADSAPMSNGDLDVEGLLDALATADGKSAGVLAAFYAELVGMVRVAADEDRLTLAGIAVSVHTAWQVAEHEAWSTQEAERHKTIMVDIETRLRRLEAACPGLKDSP